MLSGSTIGQAIGQALGQSLFAPSAGSMQNQGQVGKIIIPKDPDDAEDLSQEQSINGGVDIAHQIIGGFVDSSGQDKNSRAQLKTKCLDGDARAQLQWQIHREREKAMRERRKALAQMDDAQYSLRKRCSQALSDIELLPMRPIGTDGDGYEAILENFSKREQNWDKDCGGPIGAPDYSQLALPECNESEVKKDASMGNGPDGSRAARNSSSGYNSQGSDADSGKVVGSNDNNHGGSANEQTDGGAALKKNHETGTGGYEGSVSQGPSYSDAPESGTNGQDLAQNTISADQAVPISGPGVTREGSGNATAKLKVSPTPIAVRKIKRARNRKIQRKKLPSASSKTAGSGKKGVRGIKTDNFYREKKWMAGLRCLSQKTLIRLRNELVREHSRGMKRRRIILASLSGENMRWCSGNISALLLPFEKNTAYQTTPKTFQAAIVLEQKWDARCGGFVADASAEREGRILREFTLPRCP
ncbi:MAG: hypothetical protein ACYCPQ_07935 [Elusimicrobiota bacterium]